MKFTVIVKQPVYDFVRRLAPEPRRAIKRGLETLRVGRGDRKPLEATLAGYYRLRVGRYRIVYRFISPQAIEAIFAEERSIVYEVFEEEFVRKLKS